MGAKNSRSETGAEMPSTPAARHGVSHAGSPDGSPAAQGAAPSGGSSAGSPAAPKGRIDGLDLIRGGAIVLVALRHSWPDQFGSGGIVGVVAFFTLSGYLITGLLMRDIRGYGRVRYGRFYRHRAFRLIPALLFMLLGFVVVEGVFDLAGTRDQVVRSVLVAITYTADIPGFSHGSPNLSHLWTLANEEQFYLVWPLVLLLGWRWRKTWLLVALSALGILLALGGALILRAHDVEAIYGYPMSWTVSMVVGAAAQLARERVLGWARRIGTPVVGAAGVVGLLALTFLPDGKDSPAMYLLGGPAIGILTVACIVQLQGMAVAPPCLRWLRWLGMVSYAAYLWNYPIGWWLRDAGAGPWWAFAAIPLTFLAGWLSWVVVEAPAKRLRERLDRRAAAARERMPAAQALGEIESA